MLRLARGNCSTARSTYSASDPNPSVGAPSSARSVYSRTSSASRAGGAASAAPRAEPSPISATPIRFFYQLSALQFFPVVNKDSYKTWKDLNDQEIAVQGRGSGTEAIMILMAKEHGI